MGVDDVGSLSKSIRWGILIVLLVGLLGLAGLGCEKLGEEGSTTVTATEPSTTSTLLGTVTSEESATTTTEGSTTESITTTTLASTEEVLPNGHIKSMGYIDDVWVDSDGRHLSIDYCEFVYGAEATEAARADGEIGPTEEWDLDWYIRNQSSRLREWRVSNSVAITTATRWAPHDGFDAPCTWEDFLSFWGPGPFDGVDEILRSMPWWIERDGDVVVKIDEQYLP